MDIFKNEKHFLFDLEVYSVRRSSDLTPRRGSLGSSISSRLSSTNTAVTEIEEKDELNRRSSDNRKVRNLNSLSTLFGTLKAI